MELEFSFRGRGADAERNQDQGMKALLMADFSGSHGQESAGNELPRILGVDVDNFEQRLQQLRPQLRLQLDDSGTQIDISFEELEDFHPDNLYQKLDIFAELRRLRTRLKDPSRFAEAAAELRAESGDPVTQPAGAQAEKQAGTETASESESDVLQRLLGKAPEHAEVQTAQQAAGSVGSKMVDDYIRRLVSPHLREDIGDEQQSYISSVDDSISSLMRQILHHPQFQSLESAWRSLQMMITRMETGEELQLYMLDMSKSALLRYCISDQGLAEDSVLCHLLEEHNSRTPEHQSWSLLVGDYRFSADAVDLELLKAVSVSASKAGGPFIAAADSTVVGIENEQQASEPTQWEVEAVASERWQEFRQGPWAPWLGLMFPSMLLRMPYGPDQDETDHFDFTENPDPSRQTLLWSNGGAAVAVLLGQSFLSQGWRMPAGEQLMLDDLPAYSYMGDDGPELRPCGEFSISERGAARIQNLGLMPVMSYRNHNAVRILALFSLSASNPGLSGPWRS